MVKTVFTGRKSDKTAVACVVNPGGRHNSHELLELTTSSGDGVSILVKSIQIARKRATSLPSNCSIYRVPEPMRNIKPEAYTPRMVSIGPFHCDDERLKHMEVRKLLYQNDLLGRKSPEILGESVDEKLGKCVEAMMALEGEARGCYSEMFQGISKHQFVLMMVIDGCFILEFILKTNFKEPKLNPTWMTHAIKKDLLLLENQLPFFVVERLYDLLIGNSTRIKGLRSFSDHANRFLGGFVRPPQNVNTSKTSKVAKIFKDRLQGIWRPAKKNEAVVVEDKKIEGEEIGENSKAKHLLDFQRALLIPSKMKRSPGKFAYICSATELSEALVQFEERRTKWLLDIQFINGVLRIPSIRIEDWTVSLLRNLIAFEQSHETYDQDITYYAAFIDGLINTSEDVKLLQKKGIIENKLGEPLVVADLFNGLLKQVIIVQGNDYFSKTRRDVEKYYKNPRNKLKARIYQKIKKWMASLMDNYFNSPWAFISFLAAVILLILTAIQTFCSIKQVT